MMRIRQELGKRDNPDKVIESLVKIGEEIGKNWQSEKSAVEILSEICR